MKLDPECDYRDHALEVHFAGAVLLAGVDVLARVEVALLARNQDGDQYAGVPVDGSDANRSLAYMVADLSDPLHLYPLSLVLSLP